MLWYKLINLIIVFVIYFTINYFTIKSIKSKISLAIYLLFAIISMVNDMEFLKKYNIEIKDEDLLDIALTHSSFSNEHSGENYERLEFLGDAVLQIVISDYLYNNTSFNEGDLSKIRASYVCEQALAHYAKEVGYIPYIKVGIGQSNDINDTIIADIFESICASIYLSNGLNDAKKFIDSIIIPYIDRNESFFWDYKSKLQEFVQTTKQSLEYFVVGESGPAHDRIFTVEVRIDNMIYGKGVGHSKKEAEQNAAKDAYNKRAK